MTLILYGTNRNKRSQARYALSQYVNNISISNMDSVRTQLGMLSMLSIQTNEISSNKPQLPKKMNRKEFQNSFRALKGPIRQPSIQISKTENATHYKDEDIYCPPSTQRMFTYGFYFILLISTQNNF